MSLPDPAVIAGLQAVRDRLAHYPSLSRTSAYWISEVAERFSSDSFFPIFAVPRWVQAGLTNRVDTGIDSVTTKSTVAGYLYTRLLDDVMDRQNEDILPALPLLGILDQEFRSCYQVWFGQDHDFWRQFNQTWFSYLDATARDASAPIISEDDFEEIAASKLSAIKIPVLATCYYLDRSDAIPGWESFCNTLCQYHQFADDLTDWHSDLEAGRSSWLLSEAGRESVAGEGVGKWLLRSGFSWATAQLDKRSTALIAMAEELNCSAAGAYVHDCEARIARKLRELKPALEQLAVLADAMARS